jgi:hypothetical protein
MTCEEFSNTFDVLLASYKYSSEFGNDFSSVDLTFDEYEKSVFLTKAQEEILLSYYNGNVGNNTYEQTEEVRRYLSSLNKEVTIDNPAKDSFSGYDRLKFNLPEDVWFITYESLKLNTGERLIIPINRDFLYKTLQKRDIQAEVRVVFCHSPGEVFMDFGFFDGVLMGNQKMK